MMLSQYQDTCFLLTYLEVRHVPFSLAYVALCFSAYVCACVFGKKGPMDALLG